MLSILLNMSRLKELPRKMKCMLLVPVCLGVLFFSGCDKKDSKIASSKSDVTREELPDPTDPIDDRDYNSLGYLYNRQHKTEIPERAGKFETFVKNTNGEVVSSNLENQFFKFDKDNLPKNLPQNFSVESVGQFNFEQGGQYTFVVTTNAKAVRLAINNDIGLANRNHDTENERPLFIKKTGDVDDSEIVQMMSTREFEQGYHTLHFLVDFANNEKPVFEFFVVKTKDLKGRCARATKFSRPMGEDFPSLSYRLKPCRNKFKEDNINWGQEIEIKSDAFAVLKSDFANCHTFYLVSKIFDNKNLFSDENYFDFACEDKSQEIPVYLGNCGSSCKIVFNPKEYEKKGYNFPTATD